MPLTKVVTSFVTLSFLLCSCVNDHSGPTKTVSESSQTDASYWQAMIAEYAEKVFVPAYQDASLEFETMAAEGGPLASYCASIGADSEVAARQFAQQSWRDAMAKWQQVELMQVGVLADNEYALRNKLYSYDSAAPFSACAVDQSVILNKRGDLNIASRSNSSKGLAALEYLLFSEDLNHQCAPQVSLTQDWNQLSDSEKKAQRCDYALVLAQDLTESSSLLLSSWSDESKRSGRYFEYLHPSKTEERLNKISDSLFYIEILSKDRKLGTSLGLHADCSQLTCPQVMESSYSENALENIKNNLLAFSRLLEGSGSYGFYNVIEDAGFSSTVEGFKTDINSALELINENTLSLASQIELIESSNDASLCNNAAANPDATSELSACRLHGYLKRITDRLRTDFVTIVNLDLPDRAVSDND